MVMVCHGDGVGWLLGPGGQRTLGGVIAMKR